MSYDADFDILDTFSNEELAPLVKLITDQSTEELTTTSKYKTYYPDHRQYVDLIKNEISLFGGNTFMNFIRDEGVPYRELLTDVCDKLDVPYNSKATTARIEQCLLEKVLEDAWENMSESQRRVALQAINSNSSNLETDSLTAGALIAAFRAGGFISYQISVTIVNSVYNFIMGRILGQGLPLAANAALTKGLSILVGPIGIVFTALWTAINIAGPAYRVTQPAIIYIAAMRSAKRNKR